MPRSVDTKADFYERFMAGEFGNMDPHFRSFDEFLGWSHGHYPFSKNKVLDIDGAGHPYVGVRGKKPMMKFITCRPWIEAYDTVKSRDWKPGDYMVGLGTPDHRLTGNFELNVEHGEPWLSWSPDPVTMRAAISNEHVRRVRGTAALITCDHFMDDVSRDWLRELLARYPGHCIEFSTYSVNLGDLGWNTLFWEVRNY